LFLCFPVTILSLEQIAEILYYEGLTPTRVSKSAVAAYIRRAMKKIKEGIVEGQD
jgi:hypothetical protein